MHNKLWAAGLAGMILTLLSAPACAQTQPQGAARPAAAAPVLRAQLVAVRHAVMASEFAGRVSNLPVREGQSFKKGEVLVSFDCSLNRARLERASQAELAARKKRDVAEQLDKLGSISRSDVEQARAAVAVAQAESSLERVMVNRCSITAPFAGKVGETFVRAAEHVAEGKELLSIYDDSAFEVQTIVPSKWMAWLKPGYAMEVSVEETGQRYMAVVARIAGTVDAVSQSVKVIGRIDNKDSRQNSAPLLPGMSGTVSVTPPTRPAAS